VSGVQRGVTVLAEVQEAGDTTITGTRCSTRSSAGEFLSKKFDKEVFCSISETESMQ